MKRTRRAGRNYDGVGALYSRRCNAISIYRPTERSAFHCHLLLAEILSTLLDARAFGNLNDLDGVCAKINKATG